MQVQDGQDNCHEENDNAADTHTYIEHLSGGGGGGRPIYRWIKSHTLKSTVFAIEKKALHKYGVREWDKDLSMWERNCKCTEGSNYG